MAYGKHPYWQSPRERDREAWDDEIIRLAQANRERRGRRVLADGTIQEYVAAP